MSRTTERATSPKRSATATTQTTKETAMSTTSSPTNAAETSKPTITIEQVNSLSGTPLQAAYHEILGEEPKAKAPVIAMRRKIIAELQRRATAEVTARAAGEAAHEAAVEAIEEAAAAEAQPKAAVTAAETDPATDANEAAMRAAREAVAAGADTKACSDLLGLLQDGTIESAAFYKGLETEVAAARGAAEQQRAAEPPAAPEVAQDAPAAEPALVVEATSNDAPEGQPEPAAAEPAFAPAATKDATDLLLDRARTMEPATRDAFLAATPKKDLHAAVERLTGQKTSGRLSPASAVARIKEALDAEKAEAAAESEPAAEGEQPAAAEQPADAQPADTAEPETNDATAAETTTGDTAGTTAKNQGERQLPPVGTILIKRDRHGAERCRCTILEGGKIEYASKEYGSLSAAGLQSARDLGLTTSTIDGWSWWGLKTKQTPAPSRTRKPAEIDFDSIDKAWDRYRSHAEEALKTASAADADKLRQILLAHAESIFALAQPAPASTSEPAASASDTAEAA